MNQQDRLARAADGQRRLDELLAGGGDRSRRLKAERARRLATPRANAAATADDAPVLVFTVGGERLAVPAERVIGVVPCPPLEPLPHAPGHVPAAVPFRGAAVLVVALHVLQGRSPPVADPQARLVVVRWSRDPVAILADQVEAVRPLPPLGPPPDAHGWLPVMAMRGAVDGIVVLDLDGLTRTRWFAARAATEKQ